MHHLRVYKYLQCHLWFLNTQTRGNIKAVAGCMHWQHTHTVRRTHALALYTHTCSRMHLTAKDGDCWTNTHKQRFCIQVWFEKPGDKNEIHRADVGPSCDTGKFECNRCLLCTKINLCIRVILFYVSRAGPIEPCPWLAFDSRFRYAQTVQWFNQWSCYCLLPTVIGFVYMVLHIVGAESNVVP